MKTNQELIVDFVCLYDYFGLDTELVDTVCFKNSLTQCAWHVYCNAYWDGVTDGAKK